MYWKILFVLVLGLCVIPYFFFDGSRALEISESCLASDRQECLTEKILLEAEKDPEHIGRLLGDFAQLLKSNTLHDDPRIFSPIVHEVGMSLSDQKMDPISAFHFCGENFKQGCLHGYIMEYMEDRPHAKSSEQMLHVCDFARSDALHYANCMHGIGHEFAATTQGNLASMVEKCRKADASVLHACISGVLMEYSTGVHGTGRHAHLPVGSRDLPCAELPSEFQSVCYTSAGAYRQFVPGRETFLQSAAFCMSVPDRYRDDCMLGLAEKIYTASAENLSASRAVCDTFSGALLQAQCILSVDHIRSTESVL